MSFIKILPRKRKGETEQQTCTQTQRDGQGECMHAPEGPLLWASAVPAACKCRHTLSLLPSRTDGMSGTSLVASRGRAALPPAPRGDGCVNNDATLRFVSQAGKKADFRAADVATSSLNPTKSPLESQNHVTFLRVNTFRAAMAVGKLFSWEQSLTLGLMILIKVLFHRRKRASST